MRECPGERLFVGAFASHSRFNGAWAHLFLNFVPALKHAPKFMHRGSRIQRYKFWFGTVQAKVDGLAECGLQIGTFSESYCLMESENMRHVDALKGYCDVPIQIITDL